MNPRYQDHLAASKKYKSEAADKAGANGKPSNVNGDRPSYSPQGAVDASYLNSKPVY